MTKKAGYERAKATYAERTVKKRRARNPPSFWQTENAELEQIVLRFSGQAAQLVRERNWHASQQIQELAGGNLELSLTLNSLEEIIPWILSWGKNCEVVRPAKLRKKVKNFALFPHKIE